MPSSIMSSSSSSSSMICSQGAVLATAMAVSGTVILLAIRLHKSQLPLPHQPLRPCLSSSEGGKKEKKSKKRVQFAKDVVEPRGDGEKKFRRKHQAINNYVNMENTNNNNNNNNNKERGMPANRVALYNGILRDRLVQRLAYSC